MKKKQIQKITCMLLVISMLLPVLAGCGKKKVEGDKDSDERVTLTVGIPQNTGVSNYYDNTLTKHLEEVLNVDLEFEFFSNSPTEYSQQLALLCSSGEDLPDVLWGFLDLGKGTLDQLGEDGFLLDLTDLIEEYAPNYKARLESVSEEERNMIETVGANVNNGCFYAMPTYTTSNVADYMQDWMQINQKWLDAVGMKAPTNVNELYNVLKAFKEKDPNGNGEQDEIPMVTSQIWTYVINAYVYYNANYKWNVTDGKVWNPVTTNEYRQAMIYLNKLCKEGLLSELSLSSTAGDVKRLISGSGKTATVGIWKNHPLTVTNTNSEVLDQYTVLAPLADETGLGGYGAKEPNYLRYGGMITKDCENPEAAMRFLDIFYTDEIAIWLRHGEKGVDWVEGNGESAYRTPSTILVKNSRAVYEGNTTWGGTGTTWMTPENNLTISQYNTESGYDYYAECARLSLEAYDLMVNKELYRRPAERVEYLVFTDDAQKTKDKLEGNYDSYVKEAQVLFIKGTMDPSSDKDWNTYLETLEGYGASELLKVYQAAYTMTYKK